MSNLQDEIDSILDSLAMKPDFRGRTKKEPGVTKSATIKIFGKKQAKAQLLELFDRSVEKVIGEDVKALYIDKAPLNSKEIKEQAKFRANCINREKAEQRQTWNKIKGGEV